MNSSDDIRLARRQNFIVAIIGMLLIFAIYFITASRASMSDNVGMLVMPILLPTIHGPLISLTYASVMTHNDRMYSVPTNHVIRDVLRRVPIVFRLTGFVGLAFSLYIAFAYSILGVVELLFFPFWAVKYAF